MKAILIILIAFVPLVAILAGCSSDSDCPSCPKCPPPTEWVPYDSLTDNSINAELWSTSIAYGGQVLETNGQLQVWGHTGGWTGYGHARTRNARLGWRFTLVEEYFEDGSGCQGWNIYAIDPANGATVVLLNHRTAGCSNPSNWSDIAGAYEIRRDEDSLSVYLNGDLLRRRSDNGIDFFVMQFSADNVYGDAHHCHIFIDNVWGLEYKP